MLRETPRTLGLFPLHSVLLPGATLSLRVFEPRYLDLVRECTRDSRGFGVCLILIGDEVGMPATPAKFGTQARIEDFSTGSDGLLHLRIRGGRRFRVGTTHVRDNGLLLADVDWCEHDPDDELRPEHATLGLVLERILEQVGGEHAKAPPARLDEASWVGWRLAELLPLQESQRQALLQMDDPHARLDRLLHWIDSEL